MPYSKICPICTTSFICKRVNQMYCSVRCKSRARSMPQELLVNIMKRNTKYMMRANNYVADVPDKNGNTIAIGYMPETVTNEHPLGKDEGLLMAEAKHQAQMRRDRILAEEQQKQRSLESTSGFGSQEPDEEMIAQLYTAPDDILPILPDSVVESNEPKKYKIRRIGGE